MDASMTNMAAETTVKKGVNPPFSVLSFFVFLRVLRVFVVS